MKKYLSWKTIVMGGVTGLLLSICFIGITPVSSTEAEEKIVLKLGSCYPENNLIIKCTREFIENVEKRTGGKIKIVLYPSNQLGSIPSQIQGVKMGSIDMVQSMHIFYAQYVKDMNPTVLGFTFRDSEHYRKFLDSPVWENMKQQLIQKEGLRIIADRFIRLPECFYADRPIFTPEDFKGLKARSPESVMYQKTWEAVGAIPVAIDWSQEYMAVRQKMVNCLTDCLDVIYSIKTFEVCPYILLTNHLYGNTVIVMNEKRFQSLSPEIQNVILDEAKKSGKKYQKLLNMAFQEDKKKMLEEGAAFIETSNEPFKERLKSMAIKLEKKGYWREGLYQQIQDIK